ncbi:nitrogen fixation protein NifR [Staphylococcus borealis]|nr:nitrogen fixation protein NifR [Staphylococcus borealis]RIO70587.1 nitrogen fixation protein NifR [Staphylococcus borealis]
MKLFSVLVRGPNKENFTKKFNKQSKLGVGAPAKRISLRNSTSKASWESGPQHKKSRK